MQSKKPINDDYRIYSERFSSLISSSIYYNTQEISRLLNDCLEALSNNGKIIFCGNGGSLSDSMHLSAELVVRLKRNRASVSSICLGCNQANLTAISNDFSYEYVFSRELEAIANSDDILLALSTSGSSPNVINAIIKAKEIGLKTWLLTGKKRPSTSSEATKTLYFQSVDTAMIQQITMHTMHYICNKIEESLGI